jgi:DNA polymerase-1
VSTRVGQTYRHTKTEAFNPSSHKQIIDVLGNAGWQPTDKTKTHIDTERTVNQLKFRRRNAEDDLTYQQSLDKLETLKKSGWKVNETNLDTLPSSAPMPARLLAKRILLESRRRTLTEWLGLVTDENNPRIHGRFYGIGAWTHRMAHQNPNTANIPNEFDTAGKKKLYGKELRSFWCAPKNRLLVGCDAEGIQLRIFAHYINDPEFTKALVEGKKDDKTDPHSLNQRILGSVCKSRAAAKRFIYALLLGAGIGKLTEILGCSGGEAQEALDRLLVRYTGWKYLKEEVFPKDAKRGWFEGLDGRAVRIPGETEGTRRHLAMSGYLQNGEAVCMKKATLLWWPKLKEYDAKIVNFVHDEWQVECPNNTEIALIIARMMADSLREVGEELQLKCPLAGSYYNDDLQDYTIATNWSKTH